MFERYDFTRIGRNLAVSSEMFLQICPYENCIIEKLIQMRIRIKKVEVEKVM